MYAQLRKRLKKQRGRARRRGDEKGVIKAQSLMDTMKQFQTGRKNGHSHSAGEEVVEAIRASQEAIEASAIDLSKVSNAVADQEREGGDGEVEGVLNDTQPTEEVKDVTLPVVENPIL